MKLWLISRIGQTSYDEYESAVVAAKDEAAARATHPSNYPDSDTWVPPGQVRVEYIGQARRGMPAGVVCASFNAG